MKNYYVFICLDGVPILELLLNKKRKAIEQIEKIDWMTVKYIILDFKTIGLKNYSVIEQGKVKHQDKILTKQILYFRVDIQKSHENIKQKKEKYFTKKEWNIMKFAEVMFHEDPKQFIKYIKQKEILRKKDIISMEKAFENMKKEQQILNSWKIKPKTKKTT